MPSHGRVQTSMSTVYAATPILGGSVAFLVATTPLRDEGLITRGLGGAIAGAIVAAVWEYTYNRSDPPAVKTEIMVGSAGVGGLSGMFLAPLIAARI